MGAFTKGAQNAATLGDLLVLDGIVAGAVAFSGDTATTDVITHGLGATPDFVILTSNLNNDMTWTANTTSITVSRTATTNSSTISFIAGKLA